MAVHAQQPEMPDSGIDFGPMGDKPRNKGGVAVLLMLLGVAAIINKFYPFVPEKLLSWPLLLLLLGLYSIVDQMRVKIGSIILVLVGGFFMAHDLFPEFDVKTYTWPVALIVFGIFLLTNKQKGVKGWKRNKSSTDSTAYKPNSVSQKAGLPPAETVNTERVEINMLLSSANKKIVSSKFGGGDINCALGGAEVDLTETQFEGRIRLEVNVLMGGVQLRIPSDWSIQSDVTLIMGGIEDNRVAANHANEVPARTLVLDGTVIMGGVEIIN